MGRERWIVTGACGQLGGHVLRQLPGETDAAKILALVHEDDCSTAGAPTARVDLADHHALRRCVLDFQPTHVVHVGAMTAVSDCYARPELATQVNTAATRVLAEVADEIDARLVFSSTDMVFAGDAAPYRESDAPRPVSHYGRTKAAAEQEVSRFDHHLTVRLPLMYGFACTPRDTTFARQIAALRAGQPLHLFIDEFRTPVWLGDAAAALLALARSDVSGVIHVAGPERLSRFEMVARFAGLLGIARPKLESISRRSIGAPEPRPADLSLDGSQYNAVFPRLAPRRMDKSVLENYAS